MTEFPASGKGDVKRLKGRQGSRDDGAAELEPEELFVIEHPSFRAIIDQIKDIIEEKSSDEIEHAREYVPVLQNPDESAREEVDVRLVRFEGITEVQADWRDALDLSKVGPLIPRLPWLEDIPETEIQTFLKRALAAGEEQGQTFSLPANPTYRDFTHVIEVAYAIPLLRDPPNELPVQDRRAGDRPGVSRKEDLRPPNGDPSFIRQGD